MCQCVKNVCEDTCEGVEASMAPALWTHTYNTGNTYCRAARGEEVGLHMTVETRRRRARPPRLLSLAACLLLVPTLTTTTTSMATAFLLPPPPGTASGGRCCLSRLFASSSSSSPSPPTPPQADLLTTLAADGRFTRLLPLLQTAGLDATLRLQAPLCPVTRSKNQIKRRADPAPPATNNQFTYFILFPFVAVPGIRKVLR